MHLWSVAYMLRSGMAPHKTGFDKFLDEKLSDPAFREEYGAARSYR